MLVLKVFAFLVIAASADFWATAFSDPTYVSGVQWLFISVFGYFTSLFFGPIMLYVSRAVSVAGIAGASACIIYHFLGKTFSIIIFILVLILLGIYTYMHRNNAKNIDELRYEKGRKFYAKSARETNREKKLALLKKSVNRGFIPGFTGYGTLLCQSGDRAQIEKGLEYLKKAAKYEAVANYNLALIYLEGNVVQRNLRTALSYAEKAKEFGVSDAYPLAREIKAASEA